MKVSDVLDRNFLFAGDLDQKDVTLTIERIAPKGTVTRESGEKIDKPVLYFKGTKKGLALNVTNLRALQLQFGNEWDNWPGEKCTLVPTVTWIAKKMADKNGNIILETSGNGKTVAVPCIRIRVQSVGGVK